MDESSTSSSSQEDAEGPASAADEDTPLDTRQIGEDEKDEDGNVTRHFSDRMEQTFTEGQKIVTFNSDGRKEYMHLIDDAEGVSKTVVWADRMVVYYTDGRVVEEQLQSEDE